MAFPRKPEAEKAVKQNFSLPPELLQRLIKFCQAEERSLSYAVQKALDEWLKARGY